MCIRDSNESAQGIFLPEMLGILLGSVIYAICSGNASSFKQKEQYLNILGGLSWGIAALDVYKRQHFINTHYQMQDESMDHWDEWKRTPEADKIVHDILEENHIG